MSKCVAQLHLAKFGNLCKCQDCHNSFMLKQAKWVCKFLPYLAEIRIADYYQYWRLNIPADAVFSMHHS